MTYKGRIRNGSVVLDEPVQLPEGAKVTVDLEEPKPVPLSELLGDLIDAGDELPTDAARNKRHYLYGHRKA